MSSFPHLTDTESVRREAAAQYGGLNDAAAFIQAWKARRDPNVEASVLKKINVPETEKVLKDLAENGDDSIVHEKLAAHLGDDHGLTVLDATVRGEALVVVGADKSGRPLKVAVPYTDKFVSVGLSKAEQAERANALSRGDTRKLSAEIKAEVDRRVSEALAGLTDLVSEFRSRGESEPEPDVPAPETGDENGGGGGEDTGGGDTGEVNWPHTHDALDALAEKNNVDLTGLTKVDQKIDALQKAGATP